MGAVNCRPVPGNRNIFYSSIEKIVLSILSRFFTQGIQGMQGDENSIRKSPSRCESLCAACRRRLCRRRKPKQRRRGGIRKKRRRRRYRLRRRTNAASAPRPTVARAVQSLVQNPSDLTAYNNNNRQNGDYLPGPYYERAPQYRRKCCCPCHTIPQLPPLPDTTLNDGNISYIS